MSQAWLVNLLLKELALSDESDLANEPAAETICLG